MVIMIPNNCAHKNLRFISLMCYITLTKIKEAQYGFCSIDPQTGETEGALVAFPPHEWSLWDAKRRVWVRRGGSSRRCSDVWAAMGGALDEGRVRHIVVMGSELEFFIEFSKISYDLDLCSVMNMKYNNNKFSILLNL